MNFKKKLITLGFAILATSSLCLNKINVQAMSNIDLPNFLDNIDVDKNYTEMDIDPKTIWKYAKSIKDNKGKDTTDSICVDYEASENEKDKFYDFRVILTANLAPKDNATSILEKFKNKNITIKIIDTKNNKEIATKTANYYIGENGKHGFDFIIKQTELNEKNEWERNEPYKLKIYDGNNLIGTVEQHLSLTKDPSKDESLKIETPDKIDTSDQVIIFNDKEKNLYITLHPIFNAFNKIKQTKPSAFKGKNKIRIDFVDEEGNIKLSKNTVSKKFLRKDPEWNIHEVKINKEDLNKNLDISKSYTLKFYDGEQLLGTKFIKNLLKPLY